MTPLELMQALAVELDLALELGEPTARLDATLGEWELEMRSEALDGPFGQGIREPREHLQRLRALGITGKTPAHIRAALLKRPVAEQVRSSADWMTANEGIQTNHGAIDRWYRWRAMMGAKRMTCSEQVKTERAIRWLKRQSRAERLLDHWKTTWPGRTR